MAQIFERFPGFGKIGIALAVLMLLSLFLTVIPAGHVGVKDFFGRVSEDVLQNGFLFMVLLLTLVLCGCAVSPAQQQRTRDAWAARDAERAAECRQKNVGFAAGGCVASGP